MKGQLTIEYMISFVAFITLIVFVYQEYSSTIPTFITEVDKENTRSEVYQLSEILINNPGEPEDWHDSGIVYRIGLSDEIENKRNMISYEKIMELDNMCFNDYPDVQKKIGIDKGFSIKFYNITEDGSRDPLLECPPPSALMEKSQIVASIRRVTSFVNNNGEISYGEIIIEV